MPASPCCARDSYLIHAADAVSSTEIHESDAEGVMDGLAGADLKGVVAPLVFLVPMAEKPVAYNYEPPSGVPQRTGRYEAERVLVHDARAVVDALSLDREGFVLINRPSAAKDLYS